MSLPSIRQALLASVLALTLMLQGCGTVKIAYDHGETFAMLWLGRYVDLDSQQSVLARRRIDAFLQWHRKTQLPDYITLAKALEPQAAAGITTKEQAALEQQLRDLGYRALNRGLPDLADFALSLRLDQLEKTREKFAQNDRDYRDLYVDVSAKQRRGVRADKWIERIEYWYGSLDDKQRATLTALSDAQPFDATVSLAERQSRETEIVDILSRIAREKPQRDEVMAEFLAYAHRLEGSPDPTRRAYLEALKQSNSAIYVQMANLATPEQRQHAVKALANWVSDMSAAASED